MEVGIRTFKRSWRDDVGETMENIMDENWKNQIGLIC